MVLQGITFVLLLTCFSMRNVEGAKILALMNLPSPSHYIFNRALLVALAERGHQVTVISADIEKKPVPNLTSILLEDMYTTTKESFDIEAWVDMPFWKQTMLLFEFSTKTCEHGLSTKGAQQLYNSTSEKFDLIISEVGWVECFYGFITKFGSPPIIATSGAGTCPWFSITLGNPENPSYIPNLLLPYSEHMSFGERFYNFMVNNLMNLYYKFRHLPNQEAIAKTFFKEELPPFIDIASNFSLVLSNLMAGLHDARPLMPNMIPIGGMHIKAAVNPLPEDIRKFVDEAKDGFIFFSLGTNIRSDSIGENKLKDFLEAFAELPQRVLWKFESDNLPGLPSNVKISKWMPQSDILAHPNIKLFITHCGLMSTMETTFRGVPVVGVPFFMDQNNNLNKFIRKGAAVKLDIRTLTKESVLNAIRTVLNNNSYSQNIKRMSAVFRDQPESPLDRAVFWTEYVIRHGGAPHLRSASQDLSWYQYFLLDVILVLITGVIVTLLVIYFTLKTVLKLIKSRLFKRDKKVKTKKN